MLDKTKIHIEADRWYCCFVEDDKDIELCKVTRKVIDTQDGPVYAWKVTTYYSSRECFVGTSYECRDWIINHWLEGRKYLKNG